MDIEERFKKARGRLPTRTERKRYERLRDNYGVRDNDAIWIMIEVFEFYDSIYREYPNQVREAIRSEMRQVRLPTGKIAGRASDIQLVALAGFALAYSILVGAAGMAIGSDSQRLSPVTESTTGVLLLAAHRVLSAPAGWAVGCVLLVPGAYGAVWAWSRGRDSSYSQKARSVGWATLAALVAATSGWLALLLN